MTPGSDAVERVAARVKELAADYEPPTFEEVPHPDAALFLAAIDHQTGYSEPHEVDGKGPYEGSALLWALGLRAERRAPGALTARSLIGVDPAAIAAVFRAGQDTVLDPERRAKLWDDLAKGLLKSYGGQAEKLIEASGGKLAGPGGALVRLSEFDAFADPLRKKALLVCKIWERRGWLEVSDPESWDVSADNVLMRLALRSGLVEQGDVEEVREATRDAFRQVAERAGISPPVLDDLLWERGREDADLLGTEGGDLTEPPRGEGVVFY
ncbi:MAG TPA: hypothetical protein VFL56_00700 [Solirubrobacterales bacterium]|nr:hypothetical protein [Solirubrobacterales bacterium]